MHISFRHSNTPKLAIEKDNLVGQSCFFLLFSFLLSFMYFERSWGQNKDLLFKKLASMYIMHLFWIKRGLGMSSFDLCSVLYFTVPSGFQFADKFKEAKGTTRAAGSTGSGASSSSVTGVNVTTNGTSSSGAVNGVTESPISTPSIGHKSSSVKSNSSASSGEVRNKGYSRRFFRVKKWPLFCLLNCGCTHLHLKPWWC